MEVRDEEGRVRGYLRSPHNQSKSILGPLRWMYRDAVKSGALPASAKNLLADKNSDAGTMAWAVVLLATRMPVDAGFAARVRRIVKESPIAGRLDNRVRLFLWGAKQWDPETTLDVLIAFALALREASKNV